LHNNTSPVLETLTKRHRFVIHNLSEQFDRVVIAILPRAREVATQTARFMHIDAKQQMSGAK
jgi:hypothetical protein